MPAEPAPTAALFTGGGFVAHRKNLIVMHAVNAPDATPRTAEGVHLAYRPDVDGLRAVAVLGVLFTHAQLSFRGGYVGVDVFFVISGFLITSLIAKELLQGSFSLQAFWVRRIRRILPALAAMVFTVLIVGWWILLPQDYAGVAKSVLSLSTFAANIQFWQELGYFETEGTEKPLLHTWSLAVEEQFYIILPLVMPWLVRRGESLSRARRWLAAAAAVSFLLSIYGTYRHSDATFYLLPTRAWELLAGSWLGLACLEPQGPLFRGLIPWFRKLGTELLALLGLALIAVPYFAFSETTRFPGLGAVPPVLGAWLIIACGQRGDASFPLPWVNRLLACKPFVFIGAISYSLYLWHWPLFVFARYLNTSDFGVGLRWTLLAVSGLLGVMSYYAIETPFRNRRLLPAPRHVFSAAAVCYGLMIAAGAAIFLGKGLENLRIRDERAKLLLATSQSDRSYILEMEASAVPHELPRLGVPSARPDLLVWGDSHAMAILPALEETCREAGVSGIIATHSNRAPVVGYAYPASQSGPNPELYRQLSRDFNAAVMDYIAREKIPTVFLVGYWQRYAQDDQEFYQHLVQTVEQLRDVGTRVVLMQDVPDYEFHVPRYLVRAASWGVDPEPLVKVADAARKAEALPANVLEELAHRQVLVLDPAEALRQRVKAPYFLPYDDGGCLYADRDHLSIYGARALKPMLQVLMSEPARATAGSSGGVENRASTQMVDTNGR